LHQNIVNLPTFSVLSVHYFKYTAKAVDI